MMERLINGKDILFDSGGDKTPTPSVSSNIETDEGSDVDSGEELLREGKKYKPSSFDEIERLCKEVWPVLAVIGGVDRGLRVGAKCTHKPTGKKAVVLGTLKTGLTSVKVQWDDAESSVR